MPRLMLFLIAATATPIEFFDNFTKSQILVKQINPSFSFALFSLSEHTKKTHNLKRSQKEFNAAYLLLESSLLSQKPLSEYLSQQVIISATVSQGFFLLELL